MDQRAQQQIKRLAARLTGHPTIADRPAARMTAETTSSGSALRRAAARLEAALILAGFVSYLTWLPAKQWGDGGVRARAIASLIETGHLAPMKYSYVGPLFSVPLYLIDKLLRLDGHLFYRYNYFVLAAGFLVAYLVLRQKTERANLRRFFLLILTASMFPYHLTTFYAEVFSAVCAGLGILLLTQGRFGWGWALVILAVVNIPALAVGMAFVSVLVAFERREPRHLLAPLLVAAGILLESWISRGSPLISGYAGDGAGSSGIRPYTGLPGFSFPLVFGLLSILFSFGRGILFYQPSLWLAFQRVRCDRSLHRAYVLWMAFLVGEILVFARWNQWHGAGYWGPRFLLFAGVPASYLLVARLANREEGLLGNALTFIALAFSAWVGLDGAIFHLKNLSDSFCDQVDGVFCLYVPEFSPLWLPFVKAPPVSHGDRMVAIYCAVVFAVLAAPLLGRMARQGWLQLRAAAPKGLRRDPRL